MIYIAIDNSSSTAKKMVKLIEEMPFAAVYTEFNKTTVKAFKEIEEGKTVKVKDTAEWSEDKKLMKELARRNNDMESGKDPGIPWDEAKKQLLQKRKK